MLTAFAIFKFPILKRVILSEICAIHNHEQKYLIYSITKYFTMKTIKEFEVSSSEERGCRQRVSSEKSVLRRKLLNVFRAVNIL